MIHTCPHCNREVARLVIAGPFPPDEGIWCGCAECFAALRRPIAPPALAPAGGEAELTEGYWRKVYACPESRPLARLLLDWPTALAVAALPVAGAAFPPFPFETRPLPKRTSRTDWKAWRREGTHAFSTWSCEVPEGREIVVGDALLRDIADHYYRTLPEQRRPCALLWRDVQHLLVPAAAGLVRRDAAFAAAARDALDRIVAQQGFRDLLFMAEVQAVLAGGDRDRLLALLPRSRKVLTTVQYRLVRGPYRACWEGYLPHELRTRRASPTPRPVDTADSRPDGPSPT